MSFLKCAISHFLFSFFKIQKIQTIEEHTGKKKKRKTKLTSFSDCTCYFFPPFSDKMEFMVKKGGKGKGGDQVKREGEITDKTKQKQKK